MGSYKMFQILLRQDNPFLLFNKEDKKEKDQE